MSRQQLERQADRADAIADQTIDKQVVKTLRDAAKEYREDARRSREADKHEKE